MAIEMQPIGIVRTSGEKPPRHWTVSELEGVLEIDPRYETGLRDIKPGQKIVLLFCFDRSPAFTEGHLVQTPPHHGGKQFGVFSICSPVRPNPIGLSVVEVLSTDGANLKVRGLDTLDGTPILDIKPWITEERRGVSAEE